MMAANIQRRPTANEIMKKPFWVRREYTGVIVLANAIWSQARQGKTPPRDGRIFLAWR
jgi:hypothetical protein